ncbi:hypothetical protein M422DRAFT_271595 [Sphaerobolus stellatus SS14]|uniref:Lon protease homolog n=1 Tax=Sphaerobolus stellatus (strain SS14) TaxID=990650 RepID=A0A0C9TZR6_SPHS4|nr:hypothetical protein M422DRAFT_271595 [Sphaerobolus stellatus SS14]
MAMAASSSPSSLPLFPLPHPLVLFPASRITVPVPNDSARALISLIQDSPTQPLIAAVPVLQLLPNAEINPNDKIIQDAAGGGTVLNEYGCAAQVVRLVRPSALHPSQPYLLTLQGIARIKLEPPLPSVESLDAVDFTFHPVVYPSTRGRTKPGEVDAFRVAGARLLERMAKEMGPGPLGGNAASKRDAYRRLRDTLEDVTDDKAHVLADTLVSFVNAEFGDKLDLLAATDPSTRLTKATAVFTKQASISEVSSKITEAVQDSLSKQQKEFFLRQQLAAIQRELHTLHRERSGSVSSKRGPEDNSPAKGVGSELDDDESSEADELADIKRKIEAMQVGSEERKTGVREWRRLKRIPQGSVEHGVIRNYLEWLTDLPWSHTLANDSATLEIIKDKAFLRKAREQLDADHFGLEKVKKRLIEYLAIVRLKLMASALQEEMALTDATSTPTSESLALVKKDTPSPLSNIPTSTPPTPKRTLPKSPILLFVGPPGVGKTSLGLSIARALNRPFQRLSLGGVRDEAEIRGHRRTYVASGPGLIVQALRRAGRSDLVLLLDEVDKVGGSNFHGDPGAALLEVLDPEQNGGFRDHYLNVPVDLSRVVFILTSNSLEGISAPLLDRCEVVRLSGYTVREKVVIARRFLLPKQIKAVGLGGAEGKEELVQMGDDVLEVICSEYTREAGVRGLERAVGAVVRAKAVEYAEHLDQRSSPSQSSSTPQTYTPLMTPPSLLPILGPPPFASSLVSLTHSKPGIVHGLVVSGYGEGSVLPVETILVPGGKGALKLTGSLGDVIRESAEIALSWVRRYAWEMGVVSRRGGDVLRASDLIGRDRDALTEGALEGLEGGLERGGMMDVHLHLPAGAQKKDGPSAGIAMVCALISLLTGLPIAATTAMTGEVTLQGLVTPVGGIKEKILGAQRAGMKRVLVPLGNKRDVEWEVPREVLGSVWDASEDVEGMRGGGDVGREGKDGVEVVFVGTVREAVGVVFGGAVGWRGRGTPTTRGGGRGLVMEQGRL